MGIIAGSSIKERTQPQERFFNFQRGLVLFGKGTTLLSEDGWLLSDETKRIRFGLWERDLFCPYQTSIFDFGATSGGDT
jgi:hypothetical protein